MPSDYAPPPKRDDIKNLNTDNNINLNDVLLVYKKEMFSKLKNKNYSYKSNKPNKDELNYDNVIKFRTEKNDKLNHGEDIEELDRNINKININDIKNNPPGPECISFQNKKIKQNNNNQEINKELKKKYIKYFFGNMKNYNNNIRTNNPGKSPDFAKRKNILDSSPDKIEYYEKKIYTYKKGAKNNFFKTKNPYNYLEVTSKVNDIYISSCYDNPQREQIIKMINEKKKQNPNKIVEVLFTQFPNPLPFYPEMYQPYNQFNPYMNMYMMPSPQNYQIQPPMVHSPINNQNIQGINNSNNQNIILNTPNTVDNKNSLINSNENHINNITPNMNYNINNNYLVPNNIVIDNLNNKSTGNLSNSGNINTSSSAK